MHIKITQTCWALFARALIAGLVALLE